MARKTFLASSSASQKTVTAPPRAQSKTSSPTSIISEVISISVPVSVAGLSRSASLSVVGWYVKRIVPFRKDCFRPIGAISRTISGFATCGSARAYDRSLLRAALKRIPRKPLTSTQEGVFYGFLLLGIVFSAMASAKVSARIDVRRSTIWLSRFKLESHRLRWKPTTVTPLGASEAASKSSSMPSSVPMPSENSVCIVMTRNTSLSAS